MIFCSELENKGLWMILNDMKCSSVFYNKEKESSPAQISLVLLGTTFFYAGAMLTGSMILLILPKI